MIGFKSVSAPGLGHMILGEEQPLLKGTGGLEPMVSLALLLLLCLLLPLFVFLSCFAFCFLFLFVSSLGPLLSVTRCGFSRLLLNLGSSRTAVLFKLIPRGIEEEDRAILEVIVSSVLWCVGVCVGGVCVCGGGCLCGCVCWSVCWFGGLCLLVLDNVAWPVQRTELVND